MKINIPYGKNGSLSAQIPDHIKMAFVEANTVETAIDGSKNIKNAILSPMNSKSLKDFLNNAKKVLVIVNDATRPTPTRKILECIFDDLAPFDFHFIIATGAHRGPSPEEYLHIFGPYYRHIQDRIIVHDARNKKEMVFLEKSAHGTQIFLNKACITADKIIVISSVEPHYFAGYTGGRKSFLPGIAGYDTIEQNHKLALDPRAQALILDGNPVHEDMMAAVNVIKKEIFAIMTVLDKHHNVYATCCGHISDSFHAAIERANEVFAAPLETKADIVVSVVNFPQDIDLYQAQKGIDNAKLALNRNGILILVAKCRYGIGGKAFADLLGASKTPEHALETIQKGYVLGYHKAAKMAQITLWAQIWAVTDISPVAISKLFIKPFDTLQAALDQAIEEKGRNASLLFLMDGGLTIPLVGQPDISP